MSHVEERVNSDAEENMEADCLSHILFCLYNKKPIEKYWHHLNMLTKQI